jgi:hypothetical protein
MLIARPPVKLRATMRIGELSKELEKTPSGARRAEFLKSLGRRGSGVRPRGFPAFRSWFARPCRLLARLVEQAALQFGLNT